MLLRIDNPAADSQARGDAYCTLFVSRLSYETTEHDLEKEFNGFGPIERVCLFATRLTIDPNCSVEGKQ
jgi:U1 small nuclear ribonucleoprotein